MKFQLIVLWFLIFCSCNYYLDDGLPSDCINKDVNGFQLSRNYSCCVWLINADSICLYNLLTNKKISTFKNNTYKNWSIFIEGNKYFYYFSGENTIIQNKQTGIMCSKDNQINRFKNIYLLKYKSKSWRNPRNYNLNRLFRNQFKYFGCANQDNSSNENMSVEIDLLNDTIRVVKNQYYDTSRYAFWKNKFYYKDDSLMYGLKKIKLMDETKYDKNYSGFPSYSDENKCLQMVGKDYKIFIIDTFGKAISIQNPFKENIYYQNEQLTLNDSPNSMYLNDTITLYRQYKIEHHWVSIWGKDKSFATLLNEFIFIDIKNKTVTKTLYGNYDNRYKNE